jgi:head-tail adaptor
MNMNAVQFERQRRKSPSTNRRHRLVVERKAREKVAGYVSQEWQHINEYWGSMSPITERQKAEYKTINVEVTHLSRMHAKCDIVEGDRVIFKGRFFEVLSAVNIFEVEEEKLVTLKELRPQQEY